jgi:hypothetical protein
MRMSMDSIEAKIEQAEEQPASGFDARLLGLAGLVASDLMLLNAFAPQTINVTETPPAGIPFHVAELLSFLAGVLICALALFSVGLAARRRGGKAVGRNVGSLVACVVLSVLGLALTWLHDMTVLPGLPLALAVTGGASMGAANTLAHMLWARTYRAPGPRECLALASLSCAIGITASMLPIIVPSGELPVHALVWSACQVLCLAFLSWEMLSGRRAEGTDDAGGESTSGARLSDSDEAGSSETRPSVRELVSYLWPAAVGQAAFAFLVGVFWGTYSETVFYAWDLEVAVAWAIALIMVVIALLGGLLEHPVGFGALYRVALPAGALVLVADPFLSLVGVSEMFVTSGVSWTACLVVFSVVCWVALVQCCRAAGTATDSAAIRFGR